MFTASAFSLTIKGDRQIIDLEKNSIQIEGHVKVEMEKGSLSAERVLYWEKEKKLVAKGKVSLQQKGMSIRTEALLFFQEEEKVELPSSFSLVQEGVQLKGSAGAFWLKEERGTLEGGTVQLEDKVLSAKRIDLDPEWIKAKGDVRIRQQKEGEALEVQAKGAELSRKDNTLTAEEALVLKKGMRAYGKAVRLEEGKIVFEKEVRVEKEDKVIEAKKAIYFKEEGRFLFEGDVKLYERTTDS